MLMWEEEQDTNEARDLARIDAVKMSLIAGGKVPMEKMFPEYVADNDEQSEFTSDIEPDDAKRIEDLLTSGGVLTFDEL